MRSSLVAALLVFASLPMVSVTAGHRHGHAACGCGASAPAPVTVSSCNSCDTCSACNTCNTCNTVSACGAGACGGGYCGGGYCGSGCGGGLCSNWPAFYDALYAEFYARNPWYLEAKARESAARRARLHIQDPNAPFAAPVPAVPVKP